MGVPLHLPSYDIGRASELMILIDGNTYTGDDTALIEQSYRTIVIFREKSTIPTSLQKWLGTPTLIDRTATQLKCVERFYYAQFFWEGGYYFAEEPGDRYVIKCAFDGKFPEKTKFYYTAADADWSLFNESPESAKCAAVILYEALEKPSGLAAFDCPTSRNVIFATTIDVIPSSSKNMKLWEMLLYGVKFIEPKVNWLVRPFRNGEPGDEWNYTFEQSAGDWRTLDFDVAAWKSGKSGFGTGVPGIERAVTSWTDTDIWLRTTFESEDEIEYSKLLLTVYHDEDVEVYLNGDLVLKRGGHLVGYQSFDLQGVPKKLRKGKNILAVHCLQTAGGQYIDVGLALRPSAGGSTTF